MSPPGSVDLLIQARSALLDALEALADDREAVIVIGAQAIYLHTGSAQVALAEATKDSDLALDPRLLRDEPLIEDAMTRAGFYANPNNQPGAWMNAAGIPVDLMVPEALAGPGSRGARGGRIPPHSKRSTRRAAGLEAVVIDNATMDIGALEESDRRCYTARVAGPAALLVAKIHKIAERLGDPRRLNDKDAHDIYRLLVASDTGQVATTMRMLSHDPLSKSVTRHAIDQLEALFALGPDALGSMMAGRAEEGVGDPANASLSVSILASDLLSEIRIPVADDLK